jgi:hypothetical protein
MKEIG